MIGRHVYIWASSKQHAVRSFRYESSSHAEWGISLPPQQLSKWRQPYGLGHQTDDCLALQDHAERSVRQMLRAFSEDSGLKEIDTVSAEDQMDDGSKIKLAVTINRKEGSAIFDFEGECCSLPKLLTMSSTVSKADLAPCAACILFTCVKLAAMSI